MTDSVLIGVVDSGYGLMGSYQQGVDRVSASKGFKLSGELITGPMGQDRLGHGSAVLHVLAQQAPDAHFAIAQVFHERLTTTALQVAAAIDWLVEQRVNLINLSLGLRSDRDVLRIACEKAVTAGIIVCASAPARGEPVYPATYPEIFRMTGDARCTGEEEISFLDTQYADFGGYVKAPYGVVGASAGCAHLTGHIGRYLSQGGDSRRNLVADWLKDNSQYVGAEVRFSAHPSPMNTDA
jgi:hypothetical protein